MRSALLSRFTAIAVLAAAAAFIVFQTSATAATVEKIAYGGWANCMRMSNGSIELIATTDVGPRIIRLGFIGKDNIFFQDPKQMGKTGATDWQSYGGHRLWHAPESHPRTYSADNAPVKYEINKNTLRLIQDVESTTGIQKEIFITLDPNRNHARVVHKLANRGIWPIELAPWALTVMNGGGEAIFPQAPYAPHPAVPDYPGQKTDQRYYLPVSSVVLWSYTKLNDPRFEFADKYIILKQDAKSAKPLKFGVSNEQNWAAYARNGHLFVKRVQFQPGATYPDNGCMFESYTDSNMLELESLGPVTALAPGASVEHQEDWYLFDNVKFDNTDASIDKNVLPKVQEALK